PFRSVVDVFLVFVALLLPPRPTPFPYTTLFRSAAHHSYQRGRSEAGPLTVARQPQEWTGDRARSLGSGESIGPDDTQRSEVLQRGAKARAPDDRVERLFLAVGPANPSFGHRHERAAALQDTPAPRIAHGGHHHDVAQATRRHRAGSTRLLRPPAHGCPIEEEATVDVIREEDGRREGYPAGRGNFRHLGEYLRARVAAADHQHPLARIRGGLLVVRRMDLRALERLTAGIVGNVGIAP